jgi:hypothetical protein
MIHKQSYNLIVPYLEEFVERNPGSTAIAKKSGTDNIRRLFICPGIMQEALRFVRPVMSLDAANMRSQWGGTLYVATVKTACDELFPVAFAIMDKNENQDGWTWLFGEGNIGTAKFRNGPIPGE